MDVIAHSSEFYFISAVNLNSKKFSRKYNLSKEILKIRGFVSLKDIQSVSTG